MAIIIKYPVQTKLRNKEFFERKNKEDINWARWAGWMDTDGCFDVKGKTFRVILPLKDREPVELLSKTFESSLSYIEGKTITPEPYRKEYISKTFRTEIGADKAIWFARRVAKYIINKKDKVKIMAGFDSIKDHEWTESEVISYISTVIDGDGSVLIRERKGKFVFSTKIHITIKSSNVQYLADLKNLLEDKNLCKVYGPYEHSTYMTKQGIKTKYIIQISSNQSTRKSNQEKNFLNNSFFEKISKQMTISRKSNKIKKFLNA